MTVPFLFSKLISSERRNTQAFGELGGLEGRTGPL